MTTYSYAQLQQLWINAGGSKALAPTMAAIAEAESSGDPAAKNPSGATGLWQILGAVNPADQSALTDPVTNAREAVLKYKSQGLGAWVTYTDGSYAAYLSNSVQPDSAGVPTSATLTAAAGGDGSCLVGPLPHTSWCLLDKSEARAFIGGSLLVAGALLILPGLIILVVSGFRGAGGPAAVAGTASALGRVPVYGRAVRKTGLV
jgi:hypothetical protein